MADVSVDASDLNIYMPRQSWWSILGAIALICVEVCWTSPWYQTLAGYPIPLARTLIVFFGVAVVGYSTLSLTIAGRLKKNIQSVIAGTILLVSMVLGSMVLLGISFAVMVDKLLELDKTITLAFLFLIWLYWRGMSLAGVVIKPKSAWNRFALGLILIMTHDYYALRHGYDPGNVVLFLSALFFGISAVVLARVSYISVFHGGKSNPFNYRWFASLSFLLLFLLFIATAVAGLIIYPLSPALIVLAKALESLYLLVIFLFSLPWALLLRLFQPILLSIKESQAPRAPQAVYPEPETGIQRLIQGNQQIIVPSWLPALCFGLLILLLAGVIILVIRSRGEGLQRKPWNGDEVTVSEEREWGSLRKLIKDINRRWSLLFPSARRYFASARIRRIYAQLLDLCSALGQPRQPEQTPLEFLPVMEKIFPSHINDLENITSFYVKVRYGELPESQEELETLEVSWRRVESEGKQLKLLADQKRRQRDKNQAQEV